jgi:hypothetical protein
LSVLLELLELDELVTVPCPSFVVVLGVGAPPEELRTQLDELGVEEVELGVKVSPLTVETTRRTSL